jgi:hypothetical protein
MTATQITMMDAAVCALLSSTIIALPKHHFKGSAILSTAPTLIPLTSQLFQFKRLTMSTPSGLLCQFSSMKSIFGTQCQV